MSYHPVVFLSPPPPPSLSLYMPPPGYRGFGQRARSTGPPPAGLIVAIFLAVLTLCTVLPIMLVKSPSTVFVVSPGPIAGKFPPGDIIFTELVENSTFPRLALFTDAWETILLLDNATGTPVVLVEITVLSIETVEPNHVIVTGEGGWIIEFLYPGGGEPMTFVVTQDVPGRRRLLSSPDINWTAIAIVYGFDLDDIEADYYQRTFVNTSHGTLFLTTERCQASCPFGGVTCVEITPDLSLGPNPATLVKCDLQATNVSGTNLLACTQTCSLVCTWNETTNDYQCPVTEDLHAECIAVLSDPIVAECHCLVGFQINESVNLTESDIIACSDIDECSPEVSGQGCSEVPSVECTNTVGSFVCGECPFGYNGTGVGNCTDFDECVDATHDCDTGEGYVCINTPGSFECVPCMYPAIEGFEVLDSRCPSLCAFVMEIPTIRLGGIDVADGMCATAAHINGFAGTFRAAFSTTHNETMFDRITPLSEDLLARAYILRDGHLLAYNYSHFRPNKTVFSGALLGDRLNVYANGSAWYYDSDGDGPFQVAVTGHDEIWESPVCGADESVVCGDDFSCQGLNTNDFQLFTKVGVLSNWSYFMDGDTDETYSYSWFRRGLITCNGTDLRYVFSNLTHDIQLNLYCFQVADECPEGTLYSEESHSCMHVNECALGTHLCSDFNVTCVDLHFGYTCSCPLGNEFWDFDLLNGTCTDKDECAGLSNPCVAFQECVNHDGIFTTCGGCLEGFTFDEQGRCLDVNECNDPEAHGCNETAGFMCDNHVNGWDCIPCSPEALGITNASSVFLHPRCDRVIAFVTLVDQSSLENVLVHGANFVAAMDQLCQADAYAADLPEVNYVALLTMEDMSIVQRARGSLLASVPTTLPDGEMLVRSLEEFEFGQPTFGSKFNSLANGTKLSDQEGISFLAVTGIFNLTVNQNCNNYTNWTDSYQMAFGSLDQTGYDTNNYPSPWLYVTEASCNISRWPWPAADIQPVVFCIANSFSNFRLTPLTPFEAFREEFVPWSF